MLELLRVYDWFFESLKNFKISYSSVFVAFWCVAALLTAACLVFQNRSWSRRFEGWTYWILALLMVAFAAFRPLGIARDDFGYLRIYDSICPSLKCDQWIQGARDWGWYSLIGLLKSFWDSPRVMLWLGAIGLLVKFSLIFRVAKQRLLALLLFSGLFYQVLDLTAWRIAFASTVFLFGLWLLIEGRRSAGYVTTFFCVIFHKQALLSIIILLGPLFQRRFAWLLFLSAIPWVLITFGYSVDVPALLESSGVQSLSNFAIGQGLDSYIEFKNAGMFNGWRMVPIVFYPLLALSFLLAWDVFKSDKVLYGYGAISIVSACWLLWGFVSLPIVQVRFFEFLILPIIYLAGACRFDMYRLTGVVLVSGIFVVKYNILHDLIIGNI